MVNAMPSDQAASWFGAPPPDLTLVARVRGADWLYTQAFVLSMKIRLSSIWCEQTLASQVLVCRMFWKSCKVSQRQSTILTW